MKTLLLAPLACAVLLTFYFLSELTAVCLGRKSPWETDEDL